MPDIERTQCPFTGNQDAWSEEQLGNGMWQGTSADGSFIQAETQEALEREYHAQMGANKRVRDLVSVYGTATSAVSAYSDLLNSFKIRITAANEAADAANVAIGEAAAAASNAGETPSEYQPYVDAQAAYQAAITTARNAVATRDMAEPFHQRVVAEIAALARKESA